MGCRVAAMNQREGGPNVLPNGCHPFGMSAFARSPGVVASLDPRLQAMMPSASRTRSFFEAKIRSYELFAQSADLNRQIIRLALDDSMDSHAQNHGNGETPGRSAEECGEDPGGRNRECEETEVAILEVGCFWAGWAAFG